MISSIKLSHKIYLVGLIQLVVVILISWVGLSQMEKIGVEIKEIAEDDIPLTNSLTLLTEHQLEQAIYFEKAMFKSFLAAQGDTAAEAEFNQLREKIISLTKKVHQEIIDTENFIQSVIGHLHTQAAIDEFQRVYNVLKDIENKYNTLEIEIAKVLDLAAEKKMDEAIASAVVIEKLEEDLDNSLIKVLNEVQAFTLESAVRAESDEKKAYQLILILSVFAIIVTLILPALLANAITKPIVDLNDRLVEVSQGDGDLRSQLDVKGNDELSAVSQSFNHFVENIRKTIISVNTAATVLGESSDKTIGVMEESLENVTVQHRETQAVADTVASMSDTINSVASSTAEASEIAGDVRELVHRGRESAIQGQSIMKQLASEVNNTSTVLESLASETDNIGSVLDTIRGIAEQTNLLALNAAIEAARAGDTGRGFAVVADEVRTLAQRTQESTGDIQSLVERLQAEAKNAVSSMSAGSESTSQCLAKSAETAEAFQESSDAMNQIADLNQQISSTAEQQAKVAQDINQSLENIKAVSQATESGVQLVTESNKQMGQKLIDLHSSLNRFQV